jgi:hypothetical protein
MHSRRMGRGIQADGARNGLLYHRIGPHYNAIDAETRFHPCCRAAGVRSECRFASAPRFPFKMLAARIWREF